MELIDLFVRCLGGYSKQPLQFLIIKKNKTRRRQEEDKLSSCCEWGKTSLFNS